MAFLDDSLNIVSLEVLSKIIEQMKKCICKINILSLYGQIFGTGFFCYIPYNNKKFPVMITNNHIINENNIKENEFISIELNKKAKKINLKDNRIIYTNEKYDITIIEIIPEKDLIYYFLELDETIFKSESETPHMNKSIYLLQYDNKASFGILKNIEKCEIMHFCNAERGSGGSPIMNLSNSKVIGIHFGCNNYKKYNIGTFLKYPINEFINNYKDYINSK